MSWAGQYAVTVRLSLLHLCVNSMRAIDDLGNVSLELRREPEKLGEPIRFSGTSTGDRKIVALELAHQSGATIIVLGAECLPDKFGKARFRIGDRVVYELENVPLAELMIH